MANEIESNVVPISTSDYRPHVPAGEYEVAFDFHETALMFGSSPKLILWFHVVSMGEQFEVVLPRYYTPKLLIGTVGRNGRYAPKGQTCSLVIEYLRCHGTRPARLDRIPMTTWNDGIYLARVRDVTQNSQQKKLPSAIRYSVIDELLGKVDQ